MAGRLNRALLALASLLCAPALAETPGSSIPQAKGAQVNETVVTLTANASTQLIAANPNRVALEIQCDGMAIVGISRTGQTLTSAAAAPLVIPATAYALYTEPMAVTSIHTYYTAAVQVCRVTEYQK